MLAPAMLRAGFLIGSINWGAMELRGMGFNFLATVMSCIIMVGMAPSMFLMVFLVILKKMLKDFDNCLFISFCCSIILLFSLAWSTRVCCNLACIWRLDSLNLYSLSSKDYILADWLSLEVAKEEASTTKPTQLFLAFFVFLLFMVGPKRRGITILTTKSTMKSDLRVITIKLL